MLSKAGQYERHGGRERSREESGERGGGKQGGEGGKRGLVAAVDQEGNDHIGMSPVWNIMLLLRQEMV